MVKKTNTPTKKDIQAQDDTAMVTASTMSQDLKNSVLIVSLTANLFVLALWIALQVTAHYDSQLAGFLLGR